MFNGQFGWGMKVEWESTRRNVQNTAAWLIEAIRKATVEIKFSWSFVRLTTIFLPQNVFVPSGFHACPRCKWQKWIEPKPRCEWTRQHSGNIQRHYSARLGKTKISVKEKVLQITKAPFSSKIFSDIVEFVHGVWTMLGSKGQVDRSGGFRGDWYHVIWNPLHIIIDNVCMFCLVFQSVLR